MADRQTMADGPADGLGIAFRVILVAVELIKRPGVRARLKDCNSVGAIEVLAGLESACDFDLMSALGLQGTADVVPVKDSDYHSSCVLAAAHSVDILALRLNLARVHHQGLT